MIEYRLVRSKRRTVAIQILPDGQVEVRAPLRCSKQVIDSFIAQKERWITEKLKTVSSQLSNRQNFSMKPGDTFPFQGREVPCESSGSASLFFDGTVFRLPLEWFGEEAGEEISAQRRTAIVELYRRLTLPLVLKRIPVYAQMLGVSPTAVRATGACQRWGSCSGRNSLSFSWMLAAADPSSLDYVVVHELCHIIEHNHSAAFWRLVEGVLPDYKKRQLLLRETEKRLKMWG